MFDKVIIIGLGLIGGSIARDIKNKRLAEEVLAYNRNKDSLDWAKNKNIIDGNYNFDQKLSDNDLVIIATPLSKYEETLEKISKNISQNTLIIDVGSVKSFIEIDILPKFPNLKDNFISCHPIAGSEKVGVENSQNGLFKSKKTFIINDRKESSENINKAKVFWQKIGSEVEFISSNKHDKIYALISHLPQLISFKFKDEEFDKIEDSLLKKHFRLQNSNPDIWQDIFELNKVNLDYYFNIFTKNFSDLSQNLKNRKYEEIINKISKIDFSDHELVKIPNQNRQNILLRIIIVISYILIDDIKSFRAHVGSGFKDFTIILSYVKYLLLNEELLDFLQNEH